MNWDALGLLVRLSLAIPFLVGGAFRGYGHIQTFGMPAWLLSLVAMSLLLDIGVRAARPERASVDRPPGQNDSRRYPA